LPDVALSTTVRVALKLPEVALTNPSVTLQVAPAASVAPQALLCVKAVGLAPPSMMDVIVNVVVPVFVSVAVWLAEAEAVVAAKVKVEGDSVAVTGGAVAGPESATDTTSLELLRSATEYVEVSVPADFGVKVKVTVQPVPGAMMPLQLLLWVKSVESVKVPAVMKRELPPPLVRAAVIEALAAPTAVDGKVMVLGETEKAPLPVPVSDTVIV
jgi:hypothetical protein